MLGTFSGCTRPRITAHNLDRKSNEREGIPFYLPKPYLVISKNVRYIPAPSIGLTETVPIPNSFDDSFKEFSMTGDVKQSRSVQVTRTVTETASASSGGGGGAAPAGGEKPPAAEEPKKSAKDEGGSGSGGSTSTSGAKTRQTGDAKKSGDGESGGASGGAGSEGKTPPAKPAADAGGGSGHGTQVTDAIIKDVVPAGSIPDGLIPDTFYTYQFVYLPDLTQKYGLDIRGGSGEFRATMNLVNGWMNTGAGPLYFRDSTTAASIAATGMAVGNVVDSVAGLSGVKGGSSGASILPEVLKALVGASTPQFDVQGKPVEKTHPELQGIENFAEIYVFEPHLVYDCQSPTEKSVEWRLLTTNIGKGQSWPIKMSRPFLGVSGSTSGSSQTRFSKKDVIDKINAFSNGRCVELIESSLKIEPDNFENAGIIRITFDVKPGKNCSKGDTKELELGNNLTSELNLDPGSVVVNLNKD